MTSKMPASGRASKLPGSSLSLMGEDDFRSNRLACGVKILSNINLGIIILYADAQGTSKIQVSRIGGYPWNYHQAQSCF